MEKFPHSFEEVKNVLAGACNGKVQPKHILLSKPPGFLSSQFDLSVDIGFRLAKLDGAKPPLTWAEEICKQVCSQDSALIAAVQPSPPGYVNLKLKNTALSQAIFKVFKERSKYPLGINWKHYDLPSSVLLEYCSANPTGPPHFGHARGAILGDTLARLFCHIGTRVHREHYVNDIGSQIEKLGASTAARFRQEVLKEADYSFPEDGYPGDYLIDLAKNLPEEAASWSKDQFMDRAKQEMLELIKKELESIGVAFDEYFSEAQLHREGLVQRVIVRLENLGFVVQEGGAIFFKARGLSDLDKERVLQRSNGQPTYFASDLAYHEAKFSRSFECMINIWGADHHGYVSRIRLALEALGFDTARLEIILVQMVRLLRQGKPVALSKRGGDYLHLSQIVSEVGKDALRFFLNHRTPNAQLDFDLDLAKKKTPENPIYLIQYAYARIASIKREKFSRGIVWPEEENTDSEVFGFEDNQKTRSLIITLAFFSESILASLRYRSAHHLTNYLMELAREFHSYYETHPILTEPDSRLALARYRVCEATAQVLCIGLELLGISAPEKM